MSMRKHKPVRRRFHLERLELRAMLASDTVWNHVNWDPAADAPVAGETVRGADAFYSGGSRNVGLELHPRRLAVTMASPDIQLPEGLTRVWGMATVGNVYEWTADVTPAFVSEVNSILGVAEVVPVYTDLASGTDMTVLNEVIVGFKPNEKPADFFARHTEFESFHRVAGTTTQYVGMMSKHAGRAAIDLANRLNTDPSVEWVHPNFYVNFERHFIPNDPRFGNQWHLRNIGQGGGTTDADADVDLAWDVNQGGSSSIIVAVIDDGVQSNHPDLSIWTNPGEVDGDGVDNDGNGWVDDIHGWNFVTLTNASEPIGTDAHGTAVAGVAAARGNNGLGVVGPAYNSPVMSIKVFHNNATAALDDFASALLYAAGITADGNGTWRSGDLVNNSWGGGGPFPSMNAALAIGVVDGRSGLGSTYFFSSGNNGSGVLGEPSGQSAVTPGVIAIGSTTNQGFRSGYSQYGAALDIVSPSNGGTLAIDTTDRTGADGYAAGDYTGTGGTGFGGTSSASPLAAGIGALALAQAEIMGVTLRPADFRAMIRNSTDLIGGVTYNINTGKHIEYGFGRINGFTLVDGVGKPEISVVNTTADLPTNSVVNLGSTLVGQFVETTLRIRNQGSEPLNIDSMTVPAPFEVRNFTPTVLAIGGAMTFTIRFAPVGPGNFAEDLVIGTNDADESAFILRLQGVSVAPQIGGSIFEDYDGNGVFDSFERGSNLDGGGVVFLDRDSSGDFSAGDTTAPIDVNGFFTFTGLPLGIYELYVDNPASWKLTSAPMRTIDLSTSGSFSIGNNFGFSKRDRAYDRVIEDYNADGAFNGIDVPLRDWIVSLGTDTQTVTSPGPVNIIDAGTVFSPIDVTLSGLVVDINVNVNITHTWTSDLIITLIAPDGTEVALASGVGGSGDNFTNTTFDDSATVPIAAGAPPFTGTFIPAQPLSGMNLKSITGTWQLKVEDTFPADDGTILDWSMTIVRDLAALSDANGYALVDIPAGTDVPSQLTLQAPYEYTLPVDGIQRITPIGEPIYDRIYGVKLPDLPPTDIRLTNASVLENRSDVFVGRLTSTDPNLGNTFTYSLVGGFGSANNNMFQIRNVDELWLVTAANYEVQQNLFVRIRSTDNTGLAYTEAMTITVLNENETPLTIALTPTTVREDANPGTLIGAFTSTDTDFLTDFVFNYSLVSGAGGGDNATFLITGNQLRLNGPIDFEVSPQLFVRVRSTDLGGLFVERTFTITVTNVNEPPTTVLLSNNQLPENELADYLIGTFSSNDPDASETLTYSLVAGAGASDNIMFGIAGSELRSKVTFNFEARTDYFIRVRVTDFQGLFSERAFTVRVTDVNEPPDRIRLSANRLMENLPSGVAIGTVSATDPDSGDAASVSLVPGQLDNASFVLVGDELRSNATFDFESKRIYQVLVQAVDASGTAFQSTLDIEILNQNEQPTGAFLTPDTVAENAAIGTAVGAFGSIDPDQENVFKYEFVAGAGSDDNLLFTIAGNELRTNQVFDFFVKNAYTIRVKTTDLGGLSAEQVLAVHVSNVNDPPFDIALSSNTVDENLPVGTAIGNFTSSDADDIDSYTYTLVPGAGDNDNTLFAISGGELRTNAVLNFESKNQFSIRVRTRDAGGLMYDRSFQILVSNVNEMPLSIRLTKRSIPENSAAGTPLGLLTTLDTDSLTDTVFNYSLVDGVGATNNSLFSINGNIVVLMGTLDFEALQALSIRVRSTDAGGLFLETPFAIDVTNVNEAPTSIQLSHSMLDENLPADSLVGVLSNNDPDTPDGHRYTLVSGTGAEDNLLFVVVNNELRTRQPLNFEGSHPPTYLVRVRGTDRAGLFADSQLTITLNDKNDAPSNVALETLTIAENLPIGTTVSKILGTDEDANAVLSYALVAGGGDADNAQFTVIGNELVANSSFDFETKQSYLLRLRASDQFGLSVERQVTVGIVNVNEQPSDIRLTPSQVFEAQPIGTVVGSLSTTDVDVNDAFTYTLVSGDGDTGNARFAVVGSQIRTTQVFDFDLGAAHTIRVRSVDSGNLATEKVIAIQIVNINDPPTQIGLSNNVLVENSALGTAIGSLQTTDADDSDTFTYTLVSGTGDVDNNRWSIAGNQLLANSDLDFEQKPTHNVRVRATDAGGLWFERSFALSISNINESPTALNLTGALIDENAVAGTLVGTLSTLDPDVADSTFQYALVSGTGSTDNGSFLLSGNRLLSAGNFDFETKSLYSIRLRTTDAGGLSFDRALTVGIRDLNEAPRITSFVSNAVENALTSVSIATVSALDPDAGDSIVYSTVSGIGSEDNGAITIDPLTGLVFPRSPLNFEQDPVLQVRLRVTDSKGLFEELAVQIAVGNVNDAPTALQISNSTVLENSPLGRLVGTLSTSDQDVGDTFVYSLVNGDGGADNGQFVIAGDRLLTNGDFDFESKSLFTVRVRSIDVGSASTERVLAISVVDVNEAPTNVAITNTAVAENGAPTGVVGSLSTTDQDTWDSFTYAIVPQAGNSDHLAFSISGSQLRTTRSLNFEQQSVYRIAILSSDSGGNSVLKDFSIDVSNVEEPPTAIDLIGNSILEGSPPGSTVGVLSGFDPDELGALSYSLPSGLFDNDAFRLFGSQLLTNTNLDFETRSFYTVYVRATDFAGSQTDSVFTVSVLDANEPATQLSLSNTQLAENSASRLIGTLFTNDPDFVEVYAYQFIDGNGSTDNPAFEIVNGQLYTKSAFDFETKNSYQVRILGVDSAMNQVQSAFLINVVDQNDAPTAVILTPSSLVENAGPDRVVGLLSAMDQDAGDTFSYFFTPVLGVSTSANFRIAGNQLIARPSFNFEAQAIYVESITVVDRSGASISQPITVTISNVNEAPTSVALSNQAVDENQPVGTLVGLLTGTDVDFGDSMTFTLVNGSGGFDNAKFRITGNRLESNARFNFEVQDVYSVRVRGTDAGGLFIERPFIVTISNLAEAPPVATSDTYRTSYGRPILMNVLSNDIGVNAAIDPATVRILTSPLQGTATVLSDGRIQYTHNVAAPIQVVMQYEVSDLNQVVSNVGTVIVTFYSAYQNQINPLDVDHDGAVSPLDVLSIVNDINTFGSRQLPLNSPDTIPSVDINGDGFVGPLDVLLVVNYLNKPNAPVGEGEGSAMEVNEVSAESGAIATDLFFASEYGLDLESERSSLQRSTGRRRR
jgi:subtilisin-like proprotein convertase family protein